MIYVILPVHNRADMTRVFLESLRAQDIDQPIHLVAVDDGSTDHTVEVLAEYEPRTVLKGNGSLWWAGALKRAINEVVQRLQPGDWVYLANNDTKLCADSLENLINAASSAPKRIVGSIALEKWKDGEFHRISSGFSVDPERFTIERINQTTEFGASVDALAGRGLLLPASAIDDIRLRPWCQPQHFADVAFTSRLRRAGYCLLVCEKALLESLEHASSSGKLERTWHGLISKKSPYYVLAAISFWATEVGIARMPVACFRLASRYRRARITESRLVP